MRLRLTPVTVAKRQPGPIRYEVSDSASSLRLVVHPSGKKSYVVRYRRKSDGKPRKYTLPGFPPLAEARKLGAEVMLDVANGGDPAASKRAARTAAKQTRERDIFDQLVPTYIAQYAMVRTREASWRSTQGVFANNILPKWGARSVHDVRRRDVIDLVSEIADSRPVAANRALAALSRFYRWLVDREIVEANICTGISKPTAEVARDRVLTDDEIRRLLLALDAIGGPYAACIKFLLYTGLRRTEAGGLKWSEVADGALSIPAARMKGRKPHILPLSAQAIALIEAQPRIGEYVFGREAPLISHFARLMPELRTRMGDTPHFTLHDLRRSAASGMARIGVPVVVVEKILAHTGGTLAGVVGVYQRHSFLPEMASALQKWADHIEQLVGGKPAKVVKLRRR
jgi:integrase